MCADTPLDPAAKGVAPGPHWGRRVPKPLLIRSASLWLALLARLDRWLRSRLNSTQRSEVEFKNG
jgi:hypothetical protein